MWTVVCLVLHYYIASTTCSLTNNWPYIEHLEIKHGEYPTWLVLVGLNEFSIQTKFFSSFFLKTWTHFNPVHVLLPIKVTENFNDIFFLTKKFNLIRHLWTFANPSKRKDHPCIIYGTFWLLEETENREFTSESVTQAGYSRIERKWSS